MTKKKIDIQLTDKYQINYAIGVTELSVSIPKKEDRPAPTEVKATFQLRKTGKDNQDFIGFDDAGEFLKLLHDISFIALQIQRKSNQGNLLNKPSEQD